MKHDKKFEDLEKVPLEAIIKQLDKEIKQLMIESGQREAYILELEEEIIRLKEEREEHLITQLKSEKKELKIMVSSLRKNNVYLVGELLKQSK